MTNVKSDLNTVQDVDGKSTKVNLIQEATYETCRKTKGHTR